MAKNTINDYSIELGWDGSKVNSGISALEARIQRLGKSASESVSRLNIRAGKPIQTNTPRMQSSGTRSATTNAERLATYESRRMTLMDKMETKITGLQRQLAGLDKHSKNFAENRLAIDSAIKSVRAYQKSIQDTVVTSTSQLNTLRAGWNDVARSVRDTQTHVQAANKNLGFTGGVVKRVGASFKGAAAGMFGAYAALKGARYLYEEGKAWEGLRIQMQASFGSAEAGAERMEFLRETSRKLGVDVRALADGYAKIGVAARMTNVSTEDTETIFLAAAEASRAFGMSTDDTQGTMRAFSQMMGKGQVMMEELKLQLGDRMPSAMGIFARSMGKTVPEFLKMVEMGEVGSDALVGFAKELRKDIRESGAYQKSLQSVEAAQTRFNTSLSESADSFFKGGMANSLYNMFELFAEFFDDTKQFWGAIGDIIGWVFDLGWELIRLVLIPIGRLLKPIGDMWMAIKKVSMTKKEDIKNLSTMGKLVRGINQSWIQIQALREHERLNERADANERLNATMGRVGLSEDEIKRKEAEDIVKNGAPMSKIERRLQEKKGKPDRWYNRELPNMSNDEALKKLIAQRELVYANAVKYLEALDGKRVATASSATNNSPKLDNLNIYITGNPTKDAMGLLHDDPRWQRWLNSNFTDYPKRT